MKIAKLLMKFLVGLVYVAIVMVAGLLILSKLDNPWGIRTFHILSGSMEPNLPIGSLIIVKKQADYQLNDPVTFQLPGKDNFVTHRIINIESDPDINKLNYQTKGDANTTPDPEMINASQVIGKVMFSMPLVGYVLGFAKTQLGFILMVIVPATIIIYSEILNIKNEIMVWFNKKHEKTD